MTSLAYTRTRRSVGEQAIRYGLLAAAAVSVLTTVLIVLSLLRETVAFFGDVPLREFLFGTKWTPLLAGDQRSFGVIPLLTGTLYLTVARLGLDPTVGYQSMAAFIAATSRGDIPTGSLEYETIFVVGMALFVMTLALNALSIRLVNRYRQVYE